ncbi:MAG TPA: hypothetical protein PLD23_12750 [Armatimonadota bacterium]|nr:hypothetical protein [Armatimonadota bacterium]HQK94373.1 hypothetical protein [Armatimonadota bacterium]
MGGDYFQTDWLVGSLTRVPGVFSASPVVRGETITGVLAVKLRCTHIRKAVTELGTQGRNAFLINHQGIVLVHSQPSHEYTSLVELSEDEQDSLRTSRQFMQERIRQYPVGPELTQALNNVLQSGRPQTVAYSLGCVPHWYGAWTRTGWRAFRLRTRPSTPPPGEFRGTPWCSPRSHCSCV